MIHWCLSVLALKVEKSFDDGGFRLTDKSWDPHPTPLRCSPSLILLSYVLQCYCYGNPLLFYFIFATKVQAGSRSAWCESRLPLALYLLVCLPRLRLSPFSCFSVWICSSYRMYFCDAVPCHRMTSFPSAPSMHICRMGLSLLFILWSLDKHLHVSNISYIRHAVTQLYNERSHYWAIHVSNSAKLSLIFVFSALASLPSSLLDFVCNKTVAALKPASFVQIRRHYLVNCLSELINGRKNLNSLRKCRCFQSFSLSFPAPHFFIQAQFDLTWFDLSPATFSSNKVTKSYFLGETGASPARRFDEFPRRLKNSNFIQM